MSNNEITVYPFHERYPGLPDLFHVACPRCPEFGFCGSGGEADLVALEHGRVCKEGQA